MQTFLSLPRTLARSAAIHAISASSLPLLFYSLHPPFPLSSFLCLPSFNPKPRIFTLTSFSHISIIVIIFIYFILFFICVPGSPLILSQTRRRCSVSPQTQASSPPPWSWTGSGSTGTTSPSSPPREVRGHSFLASLDISGLSVGLCRAGEKK